MQYLLILLVLLVGCAKPESVVESEVIICTSEECRLVELTEYCSYHGGLKEFSNVDLDHYYAICKDNTYVVVSYGERTTFVLDLNNP